MAKQHIIERQQDPAKKLSPAEGDKKWASQKERDQELVTGKFEYKGKRGETLRFFYKKYEDEPFKKYELTDGKLYRLPRHVATHLNANCYYVEYSRLGGPFASSDVMRAGDGSESTHANMYAVNKLHRTSFHSLDFMDDSQLKNNEIVEIRYV